MASEKIFRDFIDNSRCLLVEIEQGTEYWKKLRKGGISFSTLMVYFNFRQS